jgi:hypothetical protein
MLVYNFGHNYTNFVPSMAKGIWQSNIAIEKGWKNGFMHHHSGKCLYVIVAILFHASLCSAEHEN